MTFDSAGHGRQADLVGGFFDYPPAAFAQGMLEGVMVNCLSRELQELFHQGYDLRSVDLHDLRVLQQLADAAGVERLRPS